MDTDGANNGSDWFLLAAIDAGSIVVPGNSCGGKLRPTTKVRAFRRKVLLFCQGTTSDFRIERSRGDSRAAALFRQSSVKGGSPYRRRAVKNTLESLLTFGFTGLLRPHSKVQHKTRMRIFYDKPSLRFFSQWFAKKRSSADKKQNRPGRL